MTDAVEMLSKQYQTDEKEEKRYYKTLTISPYTGLIHLFIYFLLSFHHNLKVVVIYYYFFLVPLPRIVLD